MELVATVKQWTRNYRHLKALIHSHVANRQAANRSKALMRP
jgi:hypothetical protein